jgi:hypothetical protein
MEPGPMVSAVVCGCVLDLPSLGFSQRTGGLTPASLHASARLRISVRLRGDAPRREHPRREDSCGEA